MEYKITKPLEIKKNHNWNNYDELVCIVGISNEKEEVIEIVNKIVECFFCDNIYIVLWLFGGDIAEYGNVNHSRDVNIKYINRECLIYKIDSYDEIQIISEIWGEYDVLDCICFRNLSDLFPILNAEEYSNYSVYKNFFFNRVTSSTFILSDSGDGEEFQLVLNLKNIVDDNIEPLLRILCQQQDISVSLKCGEKVRLET